MHTPLALYHLDPHFFSHVYGPAEQDALSRLLRTDGQLWSTEAIAAGQESLEDVEVLLTGWGCAPLTGSFLDQLPKLRAVFYAAGSVRHLLGDGAVFQRGIVLSSANTELAESVSEFLYSLIVLSSRHFWRNMAEARLDPIHPRRSIGPGNYRSTIGLIGYGAIGRAVRRHLRTLHVRVLVTDPRIDVAEAQDQGIELVGLSQIFSESDLVSCHLPSLPSTVGALGAEHFRLMKPGATFINTARGSVVRENELAQVLVERDDLWAVLDVLSDILPGPRPPIFALPNVTITPHIAGCLGTECRRLGNFVVEEVRRWQNGEPLLGVVRPETLPYSA